MRWFWGLSVLSLTLVASLWSYQTSLNRREVSIAQTNPQDVLQQLRNRRWASPSPAASPDQTATASATKHANPSDITFPEAGEVRIYLYTLAQMTGSARLTYNGQVKEVASVPVNAFADSGLVVAAGGVVTEHFFEHANFTVPSVGWIDATTTETCPSKAGEFPIKKYVDQARAAGKTIVSVQCWADADVNFNNNNGFNAFIVVLSYKPDASPSPAASPSPLVSPEPSASPETSPSPNPSPSPVTQPDTGTPTLLTIGALVMSAGAILIKILF